MKSILLFFILSLVATSSIVAQSTFIATVNMSVDRGIKQTADGGYISVGSATDVSLCKLNSQGVLQWGKQFGMARSDAGIDVSQTRDGGYIVCGAATTGPGIGHFDAYLIRTDSLGDTLWTRTYGVSGNNDEIAQSVIETSDGGFLMIGDRAIVNGSGGFIIKTDVNGDTLWVRQFISMYKGIKILESKDGYYYACGVEGSGVFSSQRISFLKLDVNGNLLFSIVYWNTYSVKPTDMQQTYDGGFIISGNCYGNIPNIVSNVGFAMKVDSATNFEWFTTMGGVDVQSIHGVRQTSDSAYVVAGFTGSYGAGGDDIYLTKLNAQGSLVWSKTYGGLNDEWSYVDVDETSDGGLITASLNNSGTFIVKTDFEGNVGCFSLVAPDESTHQTLFTNNFNYSMDTRIFQVDRPSTQLSSFSIGSVLCLNSGIIDVEEENYVTISPNPSTGHFKLTMNKAFINYSIEIVDILGHQIGHSNTYDSNSIDVDVKDCLPGIYLLKVKNGASTIIKKIIIN